MLEITIALHCIECFKSYYLNKWFSEPGEEGALACDDYFLLLLSLELHLLAKQHCTMGKLINSQSLEDTQVGYILQKYTLVNYTKKLGVGVSRPSPLSRVVTVRDTVVTITTEVTTNLKGNGKKIYVFIRTVFIRSVILQNVPNLRVF